MTPREELDWILVGEELTEADGALMSGQANRYGISAIVGEFKYYKIWPSKSPQHLDDFVTLTLVCGDDVEELGRFKTFAEAKEAAKQHHAENT